MSLQQIFFESLTPTAICLGKKLNVEVRLGGVACTNSKEISLPYLRDDIPLSREEILGFLCHEAGHVRFTNFKLCRHDPVERTFFNIVEDARIERLIALEYSGAEHLLHCAHKAIFEEYVASDVKPSKTKTEMLRHLGLFCIWRAQATYKAHIVQSVLDKARENCTKIFGAELVNRIDAEISTWKPLEECTSEDAYDYARALRRLLQDYGNGLEGSNGSGNSNTSEPQKPSDDSQKDSGDGEGGSEISEISSQSNHDSNADSNASNVNPNGSSSNEGNPDGKTGSTEQGDSAGTHTHNGTHTGTCSGSGSQSLNGSENAESLESSGHSEGATEDSSSLDTSSTTDKERQRVKEALKGLENTRVFQAVNEAVDPMEHIREKVKQFADPNLNPSDWSRSLDWRAPDRYDPLVFGKNQDNYEAILQGKRMNAPLRKSLLGLTQSQAYSQPYASQRGRRLMPTKLCTSALGNTKLFRRMDVKPDINTAISVALDCSGSMNGSLPEAISTISALMLALESIPRVKTSLVSFPGFTHQGMCDCAEVIGFDESFASQVPKLACLQPMGGTPLLETLMKMGYQLATRPENRKIIIIVTDGYPSKSVRKLTDRMSDDCDVFAIGIRTSRRLNPDEFAQDVCEKFQLIESFDELPQALFKLTKGLFGSMKHGAIH